MTSSRRRLRTTPPIRNGVLLEKTVIFKPGSSLYIGFSSANSNITVPSNTRLIFDGVKFVFPTNLYSAAAGNTDYPLLTVFGGSDITNLVMRGGTATGYAFDIFASDLSTNNWQPTNGVAFLRLTSTAGNGNNGITVNGLTCSWLGGPAVAVDGIGTTSDSAVTASTLSGNIKIVDCTFFRCGCPMWDYQRPYNWLAGYPTNTTLQQAQYASNYMVPGSVVVGQVSFTNGSSTVYFNNAAGTVPASTSGALTKAVFFYGTTMPTISGSSIPLRFGTPYWVNTSSSTGITVSLTYGGAAVSFTSSGTGVQMLYGINDLYYFPNTTLRSDLNSQPAYDGAFELAWCTNITISGTRFSALGDAMNVVNCSLATMTGCTVWESVMGAINWGPGCRDVSFSNNSVNGGNGSRLITIENFVKRVTGTANTFTNGGRGSLFVNVSDMIISKNTFVTPTTKNTPAFGNGQWDFKVGAWQRSPVFQFNTQPGVATLSTNIILTENTIWTTNTTAALLTAPYMDNFVFADNVFLGESLAAPVYGTVARQQGIAGIIANQPWYNYTLRGNKGIENRVTDSYTVTLSAASTNLTFPHNLHPALFQSLYGVSSVYYSITASGVGSVYPVATSADATNITIGFSGNLPTGTPITVPYSIESKPVFTGSLSGVTDLDALAFINRVKGRGGILTPTEMAAINTLIVGLKSDGNWSHIITAGPLLGGFNGFDMLLKAPLNINPEATFGGIVPTNITSRGVYFDGSTSYMLTPLAPNNITANGGFPSVNVGGLGIYLNDTTFPTQTGGAIAIGIFDGTDRLTLQPAGATANGYWGGNSVTASQSGLNFATNYISITRSSTTSLVLGYTSSGSFSTTAAVTTSTTPAGSSDNIAIGGRYRGTSPLNPFVGTVGWWDVTDGAETRSTMFTRIKTFLTSIGRLP
jgi:hypothetical protein